MVGELEGMLGISVSLQGKMDPITNLPIPGADRSLKVLESTPNLWMGRLRLRERGSSPRTQSKVVTTCNEVFGQQLGILALHQVEALCG